MERTIGRDQSGEGKQGGKKQEKRKFLNTFQPDRLLCEARGSGGSGGGFGSLRFPDSRPGGSLQVGKIFAKINSKLNKYGWRAH